MKKRRNKKYQPKPQGPRRTPQELMEHILSLSTPEDIRAIERLQKTCDDQEWDMRETLLEVIQYTYDVMDGKVVSAPRLTVLAGLGAPDITDGQHHHGGPSD